MVILALKQQFCSDRKYLVQITFFTEEIGIRYTVATATGGNIWKRNLHHEMHSPALWILKIKIIHKKVSSCQEKKQTENKQGCFFHLIP
jgi:hypothetical protein